MVKTVEMSNNFDCGPVGSYNALAAYLPPEKLPPYENYLRLWRWPGSGEWRDNLRDQPGDHLTVLRKLGIPHRRTDAEEIIAGKALAFKTVILLHDPEDPILTQHWCRLVARYEPEQKIYVDWGNGKNKAFPYEEFKRRFKAGVPDFAYVIGEGEPSKVERLKNWFWLRLRGIVKAVTSWF
jgi:hypothetical protein